MIQGKDQIVKEVSPGTRLIFFVLSYKEQAWYYVVEFFCGINLILIFVLQVMLEYVPESVWNRYRLSSC